MSDYKRIEDYGIIGNLETCALVGKDGSIDWLCLPHLESPSVFAGILDIKKGGHFYIRPKEFSKSTQSYIENTNVLETSFETSRGIVKVTDFMPIKIDSAQSIALLRKVTLQGVEAEIVLDFSPRFDYARVIPRIEPTNSGVVAFSDSERLFLDSTHRIEVKDNSVSLRFYIRGGESHWFILQYGEHPVIAPAECEELLEKTVQYWQDWSHQCELSECVFDGHWHRFVVRSGLVLKLLTHPETGAIAAAPTTSLPEEIGGVRNWDYRYAWIRDASFTVQALYNMGHIQEAMDYFRWIRNICHGCGKGRLPSDIKIMYSLHGEMNLEERELDYLEGYRGSSPVRIGNGAAIQRQLDIYGELVNALYEIHRYGEDISREDWEFIYNIANYVCDIWMCKDSGIWEVRDKPRHYTYSKLMCWVALDRSIKIALEHNFEAPLEKWKKECKSIKQAILKRGFNSKLNSFVQSFDSEILDATSLLVPVMGFLPYEDPRVVGTIETILRELTEDGLVYRYIGDDGLAGREGSFVICTFWLVETLALSGQLNKAEELFSGILGYISPLGLFAEEIDSSAGIQLGNFPQAFSHIGLINSALYLGRVRGKRHIGPEPVGIGHTG